MHNVFFESQSHEPAQKYESSFFPARIMSPAEVSHAVARYPQEVRDWTLGRYCLCGDVRSEYFVALQAEIREQVEVSMTAYDSPAGGSYAVISHRLLEFFEHRFLLPLYEPSVRALLVGLSQEKLSFLFGNDGGKDAVLLKADLNTKPFGLLLAKASALPDSLLREVIAEFPKVINAMNSPNLDTGARSGLPVSNVSVSVVLPSTAAWNFLKGKGDKDNSPGVFNFRKADTIH